MTGRLPFVGSGRLQEGGALATRKQDFVSHIQGVEGRHTADMTDMNPPIPALTGSTVQDQMTNLAQLLFDAGTGFVSIGNAGPDGYQGPDGYALGSYNINTIETPTLEEAFQAAFLDYRLKGGGIILVLPGTYVLTSTVEVPPGITIMGENAGTLIIGQMANQSMFLIDGYAQDFDIGGDSGTGVILLNTGSNFWKNKFVNIMLSDNLGGEILSGDASMTSVPMISLTKGANLECSNVTFMGRLNAGSIIFRGKTQAAIGTTSGNSFGTTLTCDHCFFDGFKTAINFNPSSGDKDFLNVTNCKIRVYGAESIGAPITGDPAISATLCNASITNNYYIGAGTWTNVFLYFSSSGGSTSNVKVTVSNNTGSPTSTVTSSICKNNSGITFSSSIVGNNWGNDISNPWFIVVGTTAEPIGDINGPNAINIILQMANSNNFYATVIVNPGTYNVTGNADTSFNWTKLKFIGNKNGKKYPIFSINLTSSVPDALGNNFLVLGNYIESIQFKNGQLSTPSIVPSFNATSNSTQTPAHFLHIKDCIFTDVSLRLMDIGSAPFTDTSSITAKLHIIIEDCDFRQTGSFSDNLSLCSPIADTIKIINCNFSGNGYALCVGDTTYSSAIIANNSLLIENCTFDLSGSTITGTPPSGAYNYINVNSLFGKVLIKNCQAITSLTLENASPIDTGLTSTGSFSKFIYIIARDTEVVDSIINGPVQAFTDSAIDYNMPSIFIESTNSVRVLNTKFYGGSLPLQLGGDNFTKGAVFVQGCEFSGTNTAGQYTQLDIDFNYTTVVSTKYTIIVKDNVFKGSTVTDKLVRHTNMTSGAYDAHGVVQIYANNYDVIFSDNKIQTTIPVSPADYTHYSGTVINCYDSTINSGSRPCSVTVHDNNINITNLYFSGSASNTATDLWIKSADVKIHNNYFQLYNFAAFGPTVTTNLAGCLYINTLPVNTYSDAIVTDNSFSSRDNFGASTTGTAILVGGFIIIDSVSGKGRIINNSFSDKTLDGTNPAIVLDQTSAPNNWIITENKNQTEYYYLRGNTGTTATDFIASNMVLQGVYNTNPIVKFIDGITFPDPTILINYTAAASAQFGWIISLYNFLPKNVNILAIILVASSDQVLDQGEFTFELSATTPGATAASPQLDFTSGGGYSANFPLLLGITPDNTNSANTYINSVSELPTITIRCTNIQNSVDAIISLSAVGVVYKW